MSGLAVFVDLDGLRALVVGGGAVATRKVKQLTAGHARVRLVAPTLCEELEQLVLQFAIPVERRAYHPDDIEDAHLVFAATNDRAVNEAVARDADALGRLANVTDDARGGMFSVMAMHRRGPLTIAVNTGGLPAAALRIRDALADRFDARYGDALEELVQLRRRMLASGQRDKWRECAAAIVDDEFCDTVEDGALNQRIAPWR